MNIDPVPGDIQDFPDLITAINQSIDEINQQFNSQSSSQNGSLVSNVGQSYGSSAFTYSNPDTDIYDFLDPLYASLRNAQILVSQAQVQANAIGLAQLQLGAVTAGAIAPNSIYPGAIQVGAVQTDNLSANSVTSFAIAANAVYAGAIQAGAITTNKIAAGAVVSTSIAAGTIVGTNIAATTITASNLNIATLSAITASMGTLTAGNIVLANSSGNFIEGGQTAYNTGTGFWLGYNSSLSAYAFSIGSSTNYLTWDGTTLTIAGSIVVSSISGLNYAGSASAGGPANTISGQGALATQNTADYSTQVTGTPVSGTTGSITVSPSPSGAGLYLGSTNLGYYSGSAWTTYMDSSGHFYLGGTSGALQWNGTTLTITGDINVTTISGLNYAGSGSPGGAANSITSQGALATANSVSYTNSSQVTNTPVNGSTGAITVTATPGGSGLFLGMTHLGYYSGSAWTTYMDNSGNFYLGGTSGALQWNGSTLTINGGGTFSGSLSAATGTFAGSLSAATGTFAGSLSAATGSFSGTITSTSGTIGGFTIGSTTMAAAGISLDAGNGQVLLSTAGLPGFGNYTSAQLFCTDMTYLTSKWGVGGLVLNSWAQGGTNTGTITLFPSPYWSTSPNRWLDINNASGGDFYVDSYTNLYMTGTIYSSGGNFTVDASGNVVAAAQISGASLSISGNAGVTGVFGLTGALHASSSITCITLFVNHSSTFNPGSNVSAAIATSGSYGGGIVLQDSSYYAGLWTDSGGSNLHFGAGGTSSLTSYLTVSGSAVTLNAPLQLNNAYVSGAPGATGYIEILDSSSRVCKVLTA